MTQLQFAFMTLLSISPLLVLAALRSRAGALRMISQAGKVFLEISGRSLPSITAEDLVGLPSSSDVQVRVRGGCHPAATLLPVLRLERLIRARNVLELGTQFGATTWHLAANLEPGGHCTTVDLPSDSAESARGEHPRERLGVCFADTPESGLIVQIRADSTTLRRSDFAQAFDLVFIDAGHGYDNVRADTALAVEVLRPGGVVMWHDYHTLDPRIGVRRFLHELSFAVPVHRLEDSQCAVMMGTADVLIAVQAFLSVGRKTAQCLRQSDAT